MNKIVIVNEYLCIGRGVIDEKSGKCKVTDEPKCDRLRGCVKVFP